MEIIISNATKYSNLLPFTAILPLKTYNESNTFGGHNREKLKIIGKNRKKVLEFNFANEEKVFFRGNLISQMKGKIFFRGNLISRMKDRFAKFAKFSSREIF